MVQSPAVWINSLTAPATRAMNEGVELARMSAVVEATMTAVVEAIFCTTRAVMRSMTVEEAIKSATTCCAMVVAIVVAVVDASAAISPSLRPM